MNIASISALLISKASISDWVQIGSTIATIALGIIALIIPYLTEVVQYLYRAPRLRIKFKLTPPDCHKTQWNEGGHKTPVYYFRFVVVNIGKIQAEECEAILEEIYKKNSAGEFIKEKNFTPVNLKWSGPSGIKQKTIQPEREIFCDMGRVHHPSHNYLSIYQNISANDQSKNKFAFELTDLYYSQLDCLLPGDYKIKITIYSKNAKKETKYFYIYWTGKWENIETDMFNELVIR